MSEGNEATRIEVVLQELFQKDTIQAKVMSILQDQQWHCRVHGYPAGISGQLAGGGGIQGLQRGTRNRPGFVLETRQVYCDVCKRKTMFDRWTGELQSASAHATISAALADRILAHFNYTDVIEQRQRSRHELVIDHKFPALRWANSEPSNDAAMGNFEIEEKFQLLRKDAYGNANLLKSRACENCLGTHRRGTPFGIRFFYAGDSQWPDDVPDFGAEAEQGCVGCGWYDFAHWRNELNEAVRDIQLDQDMTQRESDVLGE